MPRNGDETRERILQAALREFADKGPSGARVDAIARDSGVNVRMIYYFFGSKDGLYQAVLRSIFEQRITAMSAAGDALAQVLPTYFDAMSSSVDRVRFITWEALERGADAEPDDLVLGSERETALGHRVDHLRHLQRSGRLDPTLDADLLYVALAAMATYPMAFPCTTRMITGMPVTSDAFKERYAAFLARLGAALDEALRGEPKDAR